MGTFEDQAAEQKAVLKDLISVLARGEASDPCRADGPELGPQNLKLLLEH